MRSRPPRRRRSSLRLETLEPRHLLAGDSLAEAVRISEFLAVNQDSLSTRTRSTPSASFRGEQTRPDWIELQNVSDQPVEIGGLFLTDDPRVPWKWQIPAPKTLGPHDFMVVFASGLDIREAALDERQRFHTNFKLDANGEYLALLDEQGEVLHEIVDPPRQETDVSYGLGEDGQAYYLTQLTPGQPNAEPYLGAVADTQFSVDRGYFDQPLEVEISSATAGAEIRYTLDGSQPTATTGRVYAGPIRIDTTTNLRAAAFKSGYLPTDVDTHTYIFLQDVIHQPAEIPGFPYGGRTWAGQNTYVPQDSEMDPEVVNDPAYREIIDDALLAIPTMSITSDPGQIFSEQGWYDGEEVEKLVSVEILYPDDPTASHQVDAGIESHSHDRLKRSLRLNFREIYGRCHVPDRPVPARSCQRRHGGRPVQLDHPARRQQPELGQNLESGQDGLYDRRVLSHVAGRDVGVRHARHLHASVYQRSVLGPVQPGGAGGR